MDKFLIIKKLYFKYSEIINATGYPTIDKVGKEASEATWLIIQHSIGQPEFMKKCAKQLEIAVMKKRLILKIWRI